ncbi:hypothetical protein ACOME3_003746 [Neoechinorhynchus agilis]
MSHDLLPAQLKPRKINAKMTSFASLNCLHGFIDSRRDDVESLLYSLLYFLNGGYFPWSPYSSDMGEPDEQLLLQTKTNEIIFSLCTHFPKCLIDCITYCQNLKFEQEPDYGLIEEMLKECLNNKSRDH